MRRRVTRFAVLALTGLNALIGTPGASATAKIDRTVIYVTDYWAYYQLNDYFDARDQLGQSTVRTQDQYYTWHQIVKDVLKPRSNGTVAETRFTTLDASGAYDGSFPQTVPSSVHCDYSSQPSRVFKTKVVGAPEGLGPPHGNPLIPYTWSLPSSAGTLGVKSSCDASGELLKFTPMTAGTFGSVLEDTPEFDEAFEGSDSVHYKSMPAKHPIDVTLHNRIATPNGGFEEARARVLGDVNFTRVGDPRNVNKVGMLLLDDVLSALGIKASPNGSPLADGEDDSVLVPGLARGTVTLDVTGSVSPGQKTSAAAAPQTLFTGRAKIKGSDSVPLRVVPTAAGRAALAASHPPTPIRMTGTFEPSGAGRKVRVTVAGSLGAR